MSSFARLRATITAMRSRPTTLPLSRTSRIRLLRNSAVSRSAVRSSYGQAMTYSFSMIRTLTRACSWLMSRAPAFSSGRSWPRRACGPVRFSVGARPARRPAIHAVGATRDSLPSGVPRSRPALRCVWRVASARDRAVFLWCRSCFWTIERLTQRCKRFRHNCLSIMSQMTYNEIQRVLTDERSMTDAAEAHGTLAGCLCAAIGYRFEDWLLEILPEGRAQPLAAASLRELYRETAGALEASEMEFDLLLPEDEASLDARTVALGQWCQGFLY